MQKEHYLNVLIELCKAHSSDNLSFDEFMYLLHELLEKYRKEIKK